MRRDPDDPDLTRLLREQRGVLARRQVLALGGTDSDIERWLRRRQWRRVHPGVFIDHTGELTWVQRAWSAVLFHWPAALGGVSALRAHGVRRGAPGRRTSREAPGRGDDVVQVVVPADRSLRSPPGIRVSRLCRFDDVALMNLGPPRVRVEHALLTVASGAEEADAVAILGDACQSGITTATRLVHALRAMPRLPKRRLLLAILEDVAVGAYSVLEHRYLRAVERAHGLPTALRQRRVTVGRTVSFRDVEYVGLATVVELDGRLGHESAHDRWDDLDRDLGAATAGVLTLRAGWRQVLEPCRLATTVAVVLRARGWTGSLHPCGPACPVGRRAVA